MTMLLSMKGDEMKEEAMGEVGLPKEHAVVKTILA